MDLIRAFKVNVYHTLTKKYDLSAHFPSYDLKIANEQQHNQGEEWLCALRKYYVPLALLIKKVGVGERCVLQMPFFIV
jgi:hypothetical protein